MHRRTRANGVLVSVKMPEPPRSCTCRRHPRSRRRGSALLPPLRDPG